MDLAPDLDGLVRLVWNVTDAFTAALFLPEEDGLLKLVSHASLSEHVVENCVVSPGQGLIGLVAENDRPIHVAKFRYDARSLLLYGAPEDLKAFLGVPVRLGAKVGVLAVDSKRTYQFSPRTDSILVGFAEEIARRVERQRQLREMVGGSPSLEAARELCRDITALEDPELVLDRIATMPATIVPRTGLLVAISERAGGPLWVARAHGPEHLRLLGAEIAPSTSLIGWVERKGTMIYLSGLDERPKRTVVAYPGEPRIPMQSFLGVPLRAAGRSLGVLAFTSTESVAYPRQMTDVLGVVADTSALALANAESRSRLAARVGGAPEAVVRYGRFLDEVSRWLKQRDPVEVLVVDPEGLARRNRQHGHAAVDRMIDEALGVIARVLVPTPWITQIGPGTWAVACQVESSRPEDRTRQLVERALADKVFEVGDTTSTLPVRIVSARSEVDARDPEGLLRRALDRLERARERALVAQA